MPQILTQVIGPVLGRAVPGDRASVSAASDRMLALGLGQQPTQSFSWGWRFHQRLANQKGLVAGGAQTNDVGCALNAAFGRAQHLLRQQFGQPEGRPQVQLEGSEIAAVYPDQIATRIERALQFLLIVSLAQNVEPLLAGGAGQAG